MTKNLCRALLCALFTIYTCQTACAQDDTMNRLKHFFTHIAAYDNQCSQEKVYLHLDNNGYFPGETIWYKAYVFRASTLLPTDLSKVLYVELLTPEGEVCMRKSFPIKNGRTYGEFKLEHLVHTGYYEIRAYTRAMLNWDPSYAYSRVIPIYDLPKDSVGLTGLTMYETPPDNKLPHTRLYPMPLRTDNTMKEGKMMLTFYPEGGHLTRGLPGQVAFKLTDKNGNPDSVDMSLCRADGQKVATVRPLHEGMGVFELPAGTTDAYMLCGGNKFPLPQPQEAGCDLHVTCNSTNGLTLAVRSNVAFQSRTIGVSVTCRGTACYFDTIHVTPNGSYTKTIQRKQLRDGILQVTLFTDEGQVLAERLVWCEPQQAPPTIKIAQNKSVYTPFEPVVLDFTLQDAAGTPLQGEFSLSVHDTHGEVAPSSMSLRTDMLLCSDLKGYIHQPEYYFQASDETHRKALDLLLMVQGWRRYEWKEMAGVTPFKLKQPAEDGILVDGRVIDNSSKKRAKADMDVNLIVMLNGTFVEGTSRSDSLGRFALQTPDFYGDGIAYFTTTVNDKRQTSNVALNRQFSPVPATYEPISLFKQEPYPLREKLNSKKSTTFEWTDTIPKIILLHEAVITDKLPKHDLGSRYTYRGGEDAGRRIASIYYNVEQEMDKVLDNGDAVPSLWDWLKKRNPYFDYAFDMPDSKDKYAEIMSKAGTNTHGYYYFTYKNHPAYIFLDNQVIDQGKDDYVTFLGDEIRSLVITEDQEGANSIQPGMSSSGLSPVYIFLYSEIGGNMKKYRKGTRVTVLHGYSKAEEFFSPDYRRADFTTPSDLRRTLYWNPMVDTDKNGRTHVIFFSNARDQQYIHADAQGITVTGQLFDSK